MALSRWARHRGGSERQVDCQILPRSIGARGSPFGFNALLCGDTSWTGSQATWYLMLFKLDSGAAWRVCTNVHIL